MKRWLLLLLLIVKYGMAQISWSIDQESGYTSNVFSNYTQTGDQFVALAAQVNQDWLKTQSGVRLFYRGEVDAFRQNRDRTYHVQGLGVVSYYNLDESGTRVQMSINLSKRFHTEAWQWYEQQQASMQADLRWVALPSFYVYTGMSWKYSDYTMLPLFSYQQPSLYIRTGWFLPTGTSLLTEAGLLSKVYQQNPDNKSSLQSIFSLRLAQSLSATAGANLELQYRHNWASAARYLSDADGSWYSDDELIDDSFGYHGPTVSASMKKHLSMTWSLQLGAMVQWKHYDLLPAGQWNGELYEDGRLRDDKRSLVRCSLEKKIRLSSGWAPLAVSLEFSALQNKSNDVYYRYHTEFFSLNLAQEF